MSDVMPQMRMDLLKHVQQVWDAYQPSQQEFLDALEQVRDHWNSRFRKPVRLPAFHHDEALSPGAAAQLAAMLNDPNVPAHEGKDLPSIHEDELPF